MKILILTNNDVGLYKFRRELLEALLRDGHSVYIALPYGEYVPEMEKMGCIFFDTPFDRHGMNPLAELKLLGEYRERVKAIRPDVVLTYTIKPNAYGGMVCAALKVPYIATVTGLHGAVEDPGLLQKITLCLYRAGLKRAWKVFFQNTKNRDFMLQHNIARENCALVPGSGVNLEQNCFEPYPEENGKTVFLIIGFLKKIKGTGEVLDAAEIIAREYPNVLFRFIGEYEEAEFCPRVDEAVSRGYVEYIGRQDNVHSFIKQSHATIHASYREGLSNVLLESAAAGRPVIATKIHGCVETFDEGVSGISFEPRNVSDLVRAVREFVALPHEQKAAMGRAGREKMEREFDRGRIVETYLEEIKDAVEAKSGRR